MLQNIHCLRIPLFELNCSSDLKNFANARPSASNFKSFSRSLEQFFVTIGQNNFGNKISFLKHKTIETHARAT